jgi:formylglycine-generating enzyme required for sulfatase activity
MAGNVWEWTSSKYCTYPSKDCATQNRVFRGGGWLNDDPSSVRAAFRNRNDPSNRTSLIGFRCSRSN